MIVGPSDGPGEESFDVTVRTPESLAQAANGGSYDARHHVVENSDALDKNAVRQWLEFEDYRA